MLGSLFFMLLQALDDLGEGDTDCLLEPREGDNYYEDEFSL